MIQSVNFRLGDSMPAGVIEKWKTELVLQPKVNAWWNFAVALRSISMPVMAAAGCGNRTSRAWLSVRCFISTDSAIVF